MKKGIFKLILIIAVVITMAPPDPALKHAEVIILNEVGGDKTAYQISHAKIGNSGYTFGHSQMDLKTGNQQELFQHILETFYGKSKKMQRIVKKALSNKKLSANERKYIDAALQTNYGQIKIKRAFATSVQKNQAHINQIIESLPQKISVSLKNDMKAKLILSDYHNQFYLSRGGKMYRFLNHLNVDKPIVTQLRKFIINTKWGKAHRNDVVRRQNNIDLVFTN